MSYRVEIVVNNIDKTTDTFVWKGTRIVEHKTLNEFLGDTKENRAMVLKSYHANKGKDND